MIVAGDCLAAMRQMDAGSVDAVVTDPPYELGFMGKAWDASGVAFQVETWREVLRVLKPGGHLLAFGGTRTYHRMTCAIEDAGFEIRDSLHWIYGTGFPKSLNLGDGRGTALKPGHEPIVLARKPLAGTVAANVQRFGTGALNVDGCRLGTGGGTSKAGMGPGAPSVNALGDGLNTARFGQPVPGLGRWPANVLLDEGAAAELDAQSGVSTSTGGSRGAGGQNGKLSPIGAQPEVKPGKGDTGGASRFFYVAKPSRKERDLGCDDLAPRTAGDATDREEDTAGLQSPRAGAGRAGGARNFHPTVKPVELMRYLVRLVTPPGGLVLDPFTGSGTTGMAAKLEGVRFVGIEREPDYVAIAERRIAAAGAR